MSTRGLVQHWKARVDFLFLSICVMSGTFVLIRGSVGHSLGIEWLDIDLIPIALIYLVGKDQRLRAGSLAFCVGILTDIMTLCPLGLFAVAYSMITLGLNRCHQFLDFNKIKTSALLVAMCILAKWAFILVVLKLFTIGKFIPSTPFLPVLLSALITSLLAPPLFYFMDLGGGGRASDTFHNDIERYSW
jgi:rod shape-determining protein MreD